MSFEVSAVLRRFDGVSSVMSAGERIGRPEKGTVEGEEERKKRRTWNH